MRPEKARALPVPDVADVADVEGGASAPPGQAETSTPTMSANSATASAAQIFMRPSAAWGRPFASPAFPVDRDRSSTLR